MYTTPAQMIFTLELSTNDITDVFAFFFNIEFRASLIGYKSYSRIYFFIHMRIQKYLHYSTTPYDYGTQAICQKNYLMAAKKPP